ncbi:helix-turn-helix transcriptional regulator [Paenibacillus tepidiphilus]|uniref:helix-turn-helix transcriptional regulator n=1 Tax=Paenibacillus tepidiphilus TaxID=2608683 RepID=UPI00123C6056|nr:AraC family transcriptional regulator [Paenibacillus tepidiphilus]
MTLLQFSAPPLPHYMVSGFGSFLPGERHMNRQNLQMFDLLVVTGGCLYVGEEDRRYEVRAGEALILRPDCHHFGTEGCHEETPCYWLHFQTTGSWSAITAPETGPGGPETADEPAPASFCDFHVFNLLLSQYTTLLQPARMEELLLQLEQLKVNGHLDSVRLRQQLLFQEILQLLSASIDRDRPVLSSKACAEQAASFLREHYREPVTTAMLGDSLNFHPVYIARCMNREYGCSPMEYLLRYRIEQSKLLLMQTRFPIARIAEEVGFNQAPYFSSSFMKQEGISPRQFRQRFN